MEEQPDALMGFLSGQHSLAQQEVVWGGGTMPLRLTTYLSREMPPDGYISSVRSVVFRGDTVLTLRNVEDTHILPGGRREAGEGVQATLRREVLEETGWTLRIGPVLGFHHYHHLRPKPEGYPYPYPDFLQLIYVSEALEHLPRELLPDGYEVEHTFRSVGELEREGVTGAALLSAALRLRGAAGGV